MPTNLALDDKLINQAKRLGKHKTKREAVNAALDDYVKKQLRLGLIQMAGKVEYWPDYDHKQLRRSRQEKHRKLGIRS